MTAQLTNLQGAVDLESEWRSMVALVRAYMRDYGKLNLLLQREETDNKTILMCLQLAVVDVNSTPPGTGFSLPELVSRGYTTLILYGAIIHILTGLMLLETRNRISWQEGGHMIGLQDKTPMLDGQVRLLRDLFYNGLKQKKIADSMLECLDPGRIGVHSEYFWINGFLWSVSP